MNDHAPHIVVGVLPSHAHDVLGHAAVFAERFGAVLACSNVNPARRTASYAADGTVLSVPLVPRGPTTPPELREEAAPELTAEVQEILQGSSVEWTLHALAGDPARELELLADRLGAASIVGDAETGREGFTAISSDVATGRIHTHSSRPKNSVYCVKGKFVPYTVSKVNPRDSHRGNN